MMLQRTQPQAWTLETSPRPVKRTTTPLPLIILPPPFHSHNYCSPFLEYYCSQPWIYLSKSWWSDSEHSGTTVGRVKVLRHQTSKAFCKLGHSSPEQENRSNHDSRMLCCWFNGRVRMVWLIPSSTVCLSKVRQHLCIHAKSSTRGCSHVCSNRNRTSLGHRTCHTSHILRS
jgi:hypothetical protein